LSLPPCQSNAARVAKEQEDAREARKRSMDDERTNR
jgi:hypothetical protein